MKYQTFLQLQFCLLLLACTLLPDFASIIGDALASATFSVGISNFSIPVFLCQLTGIAGSAMALYKFHKGEEALPMPYLAIAGGGIVLAVLSLVPNLPDWLEYIVCVTLLVAFFMSKNSLGIQWKNEGSQGAYFILLAILLHVYDGIGDSILTGIAALIGLVFYFIGLGKLKKSLDSEGEKGASRLKIAIILSIIATVLDWIPLTGIIVGILLIIAFIFEFLGYGNMQQSASIGTEGQEGAGKLRISMIILLISAVVGLFPLTDILVKIASFISLYFVFKGWSMIFSSLGDEKEITA